MLAVAVPGAQTVPRAEAFAVSAASAAAAPAIIKNSSIDATYAIRGVNVVSPASRPDRDISNTRAKFLAGKNGDVWQTCAEEFAASHAFGAGTSKIKSHQGLWGVVAGKTALSDYIGLFFRRRRC